MLGNDPLLAIFGMCVVGVPLALLIVLGLWSLLDRPLPEWLVSRLAVSAIFSGLAGCVGIILLMLFRGQSQFTLTLGNWTEIPHFHYSIKFLFDPLSLPFVMLSFLLAGTIGAFANRYLHREPGYHRFFVLYAMFVAGMAITALAGTIETLFAGWELVGMSSAFLVAYFHERQMPVRNGFRVWTVYRISDAALLIAAVALHHYRGEGDFDAVLGTGMGTWPNGKTLLTASQALSVGLLLVVAAAGKSALVPFSGWLPRAMEGPTPSSAVFYGAISVHLGAFLLLRISPLLDVSPILAGIVVALGVVTALFGILAGRAQTDIKCALSFASMTQVGIIVAEIGLGLRYIALAHILGHASLRTLQFLRAPMLLHDYRTLENAIGARLPRTAGFWERWFPPSVHAWFYRLAMERGYLDGFLNDYVARYFLNLFKWCDAMERRWTDYLSGSQPEASQTVPLPLSPGTFSEIPALRIEEPS